ncbi:MAG: PqqD family protein, partial [Armatimonadetes bacterium]|nr:PqqD family protein [Armatimonadota bacterium]
MGVREFVGKFIPAFKPKPVLSRQEALSAIPIRNPLLEWEHTADGELLLKVPVEQRNLFIRWAIAAFRLPPVRHIQLDEVGAAVWELCDGEHTV